MNSFFIKIKSLILFILLSFVYTLTAQIPEKFSYQAVVRKNFELLKNQNIAVQFTIFKDSINTGDIYIEQHNNLYTNINGLLIVNIGTGNVIKGNFTTIDWSQGIYYIETKINPYGIVNFSGGDIITITTQALSVPYALYAKTALSATQIASQDNNVNTTLYLPKIHNVSFGGSSLSAKCTTCIQAFGANTEVVLYYGKTNDNYTDTVLFETTSFNFKDYNPQTLVANCYGLSRNNTYYYCLKVTNSIGCTEQTGSFLLDNSNIYNIINIGTQSWLKENYISRISLNNSGLKKGTSEWIFDPRFYHYNNTLLSASEYYGCLYNWNAAVNTTDSTNYTSPANGHVQGICPSGWHIPKLEEWINLIYYFGNNTIASGKLKDTSTVYWAAPNSDASNESHFTAVGNGLFNQNGFSNRSHAGYFWTATPNGVSTANYIIFGNNPSSIIIGSGDKRNAYSVRCLKN